MTVALSTLAHPLVHAPAARAQCSAEVSSPDMQATLDGCAAWQELVYDPSSGLLPSELADPWAPIFEGCAIAAVVDGKLRITSDDMMEACLSAAGYRRSEPGLVDAPMYLMQMGVQIVEVRTWLEPNYEPSLWFSSVIDGERFGYAALTYLDQDSDRPVAVLGTYSGADPPADPILAAMPWVFMEATRYTYLAERGGDVFLEVGDEPLLRVSYHQLAATWDPSVTEVAFRVRGAVAEISYIRICICEESAPVPQEPPLVGEEGRLALSNLHHSPDPFHPPGEEARLDLDVQVLELPGLPSGQFDFATRVSWVIRSPDGGYLERVISREDAATEVGSRALSLSFDGTDSAAFDLPSGTYQYQVRAELLRTKRPSIGESKGRGKSNGKGADKGPKALLADRVESGWRSVTLERPGPAITLRDALLEPVDGLEVGSSLLVSASGLSPHRHYDIYLTEEAPGLLWPAESYSFARLGTDGAGELKPFILWHQSGVVGCPLVPPPPERLGLLSFTTLEQAEKTLVGRRLRVSFYRTEDLPEGGEPPPASGMVKAEATLKLPVTSRESPIVYPSDRVGCLIHSRHLRTEDVHVHGRGFAPFETVALSVVPHQWTWRNGDPVLDVTGRQDEELLVTADGDGRFTTMVWAAEDQLLGLFDIVAHPPAPPSPPPGPPERPEDPTFDLSDFVVSFPMESALALLEHPFHDIQLRARPVDLAVRQIDISPHFPFSSGTRPHITDAFTPGDTVYAALDPLRIPPGRTGGTLAAMHVVNHRPWEEWDLGLGGTTTILDPNHDPPYRDPSGVAEIVPIKDAWFSGPVPIWQGPLEYGSWDVVANFLQDPAYPIHDNTFDSATDLLDGATRPGFVVAIDPIEPGEHPVLCSEYRLPAFYRAYEEREGMPHDVDIAAQLCWPTTGISAEPPGRHPVFLIQHGAHRSCTTPASDPIGERSEWFQTWDECSYENRVHSYRGYESLLRNLASHGIIAISIDVHDFNDNKSRNTIPHTEERAMLFLWHLRWMSHLDDPISYSGPLFGDNEFPDTFQVLIGPGPADVVDLNAIMESHVDLTRIAISGHSRGGEASLYLHSVNTEFSITAVSAIAPAKNTPPRPLHNSTPHFIIIAASDCEVMPHLQSLHYNVIPDTNTKSAIYVYGSNHEWFNSVWAQDEQFPDGDDCFCNEWRIQTFGLECNDLPPRADFIPKHAQLKIGNVYLAAFTRLHLKGETELSELFTGLLTFPSVSGYKIYPIHHDSYHLKVEDGTGDHVIKGEPSPSQIDHSSSPMDAHGFPNELAGTRVLRVHWQTDPAWISVPYLEYQGNWNLSTLDVLSFRAAWTNWFDFNARPHPIPMQWMAVELFSGGTSVTRHVWEFGGMPEPYVVGLFVVGESLIPYNIPTTVRIPLRSFLTSAAPEFDLSHVYKMRIYFYFPYVGEIFIDDIEFSR